MSPPSRWVAANGAELALWEWGDASAPTVVLVHGYPDTSSVWSGVVPALSRRFHVVAYDVRGAGASSPPGSRRGYRMEHLADDMRAVIETVSPASPVHLVGHDWGSVQSWELAARPDAARWLSSFTSISGPSLDYVSGWFRERVRSPSRTGVAQLLAQLGHSWYIGAFHLPGAGAIMGRAFPRVVLPVLAGREGFDPAQAAPTLASDARNGVGLYRANFLRRLVRPAEIRVALPVQVVVVTRDAFVTPALLDGVEKVAHELSVRHVDATHWVVRTRPDEVAELVAEFVDAVEARRTPRMTDLPGKGVHFR